ncbi:MAG: alpha/beta fold hydrolase [Silicimonas sp.]|nr:alpha/beta fold hydrolase [Silicimonas sp.]
MRPVRFTKSHDGISLAWTRTGSGPPLVKAANWLTHLEYDAESPLWSHWVDFLEGHFDYLRSDERGCGLSDRDTGTLGIDSWTDDLSRVVEAADLPKPFILLGMSQGTMAAINYAARHPEDVSHLVILGGYARGSFCRNDDRAARLYQAIIDVMEAGWDQPGEAFREVFTHRFVPDGDPVRVRWFNELCRKATDGATASRLLTARGQSDVSALLPEITMPTLVLHADGDVVVPVDEGRFLAKHIPGAELTVLESQNHIIQADEPAWPAFQRLLLQFTGQTARPADANLTDREAAILAEICAAKSNKAIARDLGVSEKTIRNHATHIFAKLGVATRQEAILKVKGG